MSVMGRIIGLFPFVHAMLIAGNFICGLYFPWALSLLLFTIWLFPLLSWHLHQKICPLKAGLISFTRPNYSAWWGSYQIQQLFLIVPSLERVLHLVPGLFSLWLRAWGSEIGSQVFWTPHTLILDRSLLKFGDGIIVGHRCSFSSHVISLNKSGDLVLYVQPIEIGSGVFIGAGSDIGPGAKIAEKTRLAPESKIYPNTKVGYETKVSI